MTCRTESHVPQAAEVRQLELTADQIIDGCRQALSQCSWEVGRYASEWKRLGRTDAELAGLVSLSPDQLSQRRTVWETFADVRHLYPGLTFTHFYVAARWDDAAECLQWASENDATVREMVAWRRLVKPETGDLEESSPLEQVEHGDSGDDQDTEADQPAEVREQRSAKPDRSQSGPDASSEPGPVDLDELWDQIATQVLEILQRNKVEERQELAAKLRDLAEQLEAAP